MDHLRPVFNWLLIGCLLIIIMVTIGGITRLTESGLSITEWNLITGILPPLNEAKWQSEFDKYKQIPEYQLMNGGMTLQQFKHIYFWEYIHRLWGRLMGLAFIIPFFVFWRRGLIRGWLRTRCLVIFLGGAVVGSLGWFMVMSGLKARADVSHYRLAIHLIAALTLFAYILWTALDIKYDRRKNTHSAFDLIKRLGIILFIVVYIQIIYGAFTAGLDAGTIYNTWPLMNGQFMPDNVMALDGGLLENFTSHKDGVQFIHRWFAFVVLGLVLYIWWEMRRIKTSITQNRSINYLLTAVFLQFSLGIATILLSRGGVPIWIGSLHQIGAVLLLAAVVYFNHRVRKAFVA